MGEGWKRMGKMQGQGKKVGEVKKAWRVVSRAWSTAAESPCGCAQLEGMVAGTLVAGGVPEGKDAVEIK
jgi:hypothetical protein